MSAIGDWSGDSGMMASAGDIHEKSAKVTLERVKEYQCDQCVFKSLTARSLRDHVHTAHPVHKGINEDVLMKSAKIILKKLRDLKCGQCDYKTVLKKGLRKHLMVNHNITTDHACEECEYTSKDRSNLWKHVKGVHEKGRIFFG